MKKILAWFGILFVLLVSLSLTSCHDNGNDEGYDHSASELVTYLQAVTTNSVYVMAESQNTAPLSVMYGVTTSYGDLATTENTMPTTGGTYMHRIKLNGLTSNTIYYYQVENHRGSFRTAVNPGIGFRFAWMADCRTDTAIHDDIASMISLANPLFSLYGGDLCDDGNDYNSYKRQFFCTKQLELMSRVPFFNATGNHEKWSKNTKAFTEASASASNNQGYYSFDYGDLHVVVMNYLDPDGYDKGSPQYDFIAADLAATTKPWKIVTCHSPAYASGGHGEDKGMITLTKNVFEPHGVDLVLSGHNHYYQRNLVNGIYHLIIGSAGAPLANPGPVGGYTQVSIKTHCYAIFDITQTALHIHVYNEKGEEIDTFVLSK